MAHRYTDLLRALLNHLDHESVGLVDEQDNQLVQ